MIQVQNSDYLWGREMGRTSGVLSLLGFSYPILMWGGEGFPTPPHTTPSNSQTPAGCQIIQLDPDTAHPESTLHSTG